MQCLINHIDPAVIDASIEISTEGENYVMSELWKRKDVHVESDVEMLAAGVPKTITIYKSKVIDRLIREQQQLLANAQSEDEQSKIALTISHLNQVKVKLAQKTQRLIL